MSSAASAAAVAAAIRAQQHEEEEHLTHYSAQELADGWEFKILRANTAAFRDPAVMKQVCDEEAQSGWVLVEKFDNSRLRFKRPASAKNMVSSAGVDPYRTNFGISSGALATIVLFCVFGGIGLIVLVAMLLNR
jgi:hypothetical protein